MSQLDIVILVIYLICVAIIFVRIFDSLNDVYSVKLDDKKTKTLNEQFEEQNFQADLIEIKFPFDNRYEYKKLIRIPVEITNKSTQQSIYAQWDKSSVTDFLKRSRRVVRVPSSLTLDLIQNQAPSVIAPEKTLKEKLNAEDAFEREPDKVTIVEKPIVDFEKLKASSSKPEKQKYTDFHDFRNPLPLELKLTLLFFDPAAGGDGYRPCYLQFTFEFQKRPWYAGLPFNPPR